MSQSGFQRTLITDVYAAMEYLDDIGLGELLPLLPPKKIALPKDDPAPWATGGTPRSPARPSATRYPGGGHSYGLPDYASPPPRPAATSRPAHHGYPDQSHPYAPAPDNRLDPNQILAEAGYELPGHPGTGRPAPAPGVPRPGRGGPYEDYGPPSDYPYPPDYGYQSNYARPKSGPGASPRTGPNTPPARRSDGYPSQRSQSQCNPSRDYQSQGHQIRQPGYQAPPSRTSPNRPAPSAYARVVKEPTKISTVDDSWIEGANTLEELNFALESCRNCLLSQTRKAVIPGRGPVGAPIFFVFDTPSPEALPGRSIPTGAEAELFDNIITKGLKLNPQDVYLTPISKCPVPDPSEYPESFPMKACARFLFRELELVGPKVVVTLGSRPPNILTGMEKTQFIYLKRQKLIIGRANKVPLIVTYDLPTIMDSVEIKREFWNDLKEVLKLL